MVLRSLFFYIVLLTISISFFSACELGTPRREDGSIDGKVLYQRNCIACHGETGDAQIAGAKNLKTSQLDDAGIKTIISLGSENGKMMAYKSLLNEEEIDAVVAYVKSLKN